MGAFFSKFKKFFKTLGPGLITGASDDDPSGIATIRRLAVSLVSLPYGLH
jgi:hypothetical protein